MGGGSPVSVPLLIGLAALCAAAAVAVIAEEAAYRRRARRDDIEAILNATRETIPDHVPDAWVKECGR